MASIILSSWFNPYNNALSDLGNIARKGWVAYLYNFGQVFTGFLVALFGHIRLNRIPFVQCLCCSILLSATGFDLVLIAFFPEDAGRIHMVMSAIFFISIILVMLSYGLCFKRLGSPATGATAFLPGFISILVWIVEWP
ncbi:MAG: DUF998 domain-containing protein [Crenarchaeota archaeon]|nr:DUF998 domain-containing protein [Thermoproteota archaeon]